MYYGHKAIEMATATLKIFIHSLPEGSKFNVCGFGSRNEFLFGDQIVVGYSENNLKIALQDIESYPNYNRNLGCDYYSPLKDIINKPSTSGMWRQIFILTDGAVHVHTFGVGQDASTELIKQAAAAGLGS
jgi:hypothetical protein